MLAELRELDQNGLLEKKTVKELTEIVKELGLKAEGKKRDLV